MSVRPSKGKCIIIKIIFYQIVSLFIEQKIFFLLTYFVQGIRNRFGPGWFAYWKNIINVVLRCLLTVKISVLLDRTTLYVQNQWNEPKIRHEPLALAGRVFWKISKHHIFQDIKNSFHRVTQIGLKPHQNFFRFIFHQIRSLEEFKIFAY